MKSSICILQKCVCHLDQVYGARPLRRWLERKVVTHLSRMVINDEVDDNSTVYIDAKPGAHALTYRVERNGGFVNSDTGVKSDILIEVPKAQLNEAKKMRIEEVVDDADMEEDL
jgi:ATP-dependent Clp protease ATP-binding subunit ClpB